MKGKLLVSFENVLLICFIACVDAQFAEIKQGRVIYILLWTPRNTEPFSTLKNGHDSFIERKCVFQNCYITDNETYFQDVRKFDVVLFNGGDLKVHQPFINTPPKRSEKQLYILVSTDIPATKFAIPQYNRIFNFTWTYSLASDFIWPRIVIRDFYGKVIGPKINMQWINPDTSIKQPTPFVLNKLAHKSKAAAYLVSHCESYPLESNYVGSYIYNLSIALKIFGYGVDKYSKCNETDKCYLLENEFGNRDCRSLDCPNQRIEMTCNALLESDYYFYLAFEDVIAEDYFSRDLLTALQHFAVPVVLGGADYTRFLPHRAYINAQGVAPQNLAGIMINLMKNKEEYYKMSWWRRYYSLLLPENSPDTDSVCQFCALLNDEDRMRKMSVHRDILSWFNEYSYTNGTSSYRFNRDVPIVDLDKFVFKLNPVNTCNTTLTAIGVVISATENIMQRQTIRDTWGSTKFLKVVFMVGETYDESITQHILKESKIHGDIVQGSFLDTYRNLTYKTIMTLYWVTNFCPKAKHIVKSDDDVFINLPVLKQVLNTLTDNDLIACYVSYENPVVRDVGNKWYVNWEEFSQEVFPQSCAGPFVIYNPKVAPLLVYAATTEPFFFLEDVYTTGILREKLKLNLKELNYLRIQINEENLRTTAEQQIGTFLWVVSLYPHNIVMLWDMTNEYWYPYTTRKPATEDFTENYLKQQISDKSFTFILNSLLCNSDPYFPVIGVVMSDVTNFDGRIIMRRSFFNTTEYFRIVFMVGFTEDPLVEQRLKEERRLYGDIVQGSFPESNKHLTYKHLMALYWVTKHCPMATFAIKTDDHTFLNIPVIRQLLTDESEEKHLITCVVIKELRKHHLDRDMYKSTEILPAHCNGSMIIYDPKVAPMLVVAAQSENYSEWDSLFVTGILREKLNIQLSDIKFYQRMQNHTVLFKPLLIPEPATPAPAVNETLPSTTSVTSLTSINSTNFTTTSNYSIMSNDLNVIEVFNRANDLNGTQSIRATTFNKPESSNIISTFTKTESFNETEPFNGTESFNETEPFIEPEPWNLTDTDNANKEFNVSENLDGSESLIGVKVIEYTTNIPTVTEDQER